MRAWTTLATIAIVATASAPATAQGVLTRAPVLQHFVPATYPAAAQAARRTATVLMQLTLDASGGVTKVVVLESGGADFDAAASAAAAQFRFTPAEVDGHAAAVDITYRYRFTLATELIEKPPQVTFAGVVKERYAKTPLAGVTIRVDRERSATTDAAGRFELVGLPPGTHAIEVSGPSLLSVETEEAIAADTRREVVYYVELAPTDDAVDEEVVVRAPRIKKESADVQITTREARTIPGTQGDTIKIVHSLPGVARAATGSAQIVVWGAAPDESRTFIDGVEVPFLYHRGGLRSVIDADLVEGVELVPGAYDVDHGRGLGGLVEVTSRPLPSAGVHGHLAADVLDASALIAGAIDPRTRFAVAARHSYVDRVLARVIDPKVGDFFPLPRYDDGQLTLERDLRRGERLELRLFGALDRIDRGIVSADPAERRDERSRAWFGRLALRWSRLLADGSSASVTPWLGADVDELAATSDGSDTSRRARAWRYGLRSELRRRLASWLTLVLGTDVSGSAGSYQRTGSLTLPAREGDVTTFGQPAGEDVNTDAWRAHLVDLGGFARGELRLGPVGVDLGLRLDGFATTVSRLIPRNPAVPDIGHSAIDWVVDPRLRLHVRPRPDLELTLAAGSYHQAPDGGDLSAVFGNPTLGPESALHLAAGVALERGSRRLELVGFGKTLADLVVRNRDTNFPIAQALTQRGVGRSYGAQLLLRQRLSRGWLGWLAYSVSRSERKDDGDPRYRLLDFDQTHVVSLVASYGRGPWSLGGRARYSTGMPRTPVVSAYYDARVDRYEPRFGAQNSIRLPGFFELDLRAERSFALQAHHLAVSCELDGVTLRANAEELVYSQDFARRDTITDLPLLVLLGARLDL